MQSVIDDFSRPSWWVSVMIAGFIVNLLSAYAKPALDKVIARYSKTRRRRLEIKQKERANLIMEMASNKIDFVESQLDVVLSMLLCVAYTLIAMLLVLIRRAEGQSDGFAFWGTTLLGIAFIALAMFRFTKAQGIYSLLTESKKVRQQKLKERSIEVEPKHSPNNLLNQTPR